MSWFDLNIFLKPLSECDSYILFLVQMFSKSILSVSLGDIGAGLSQGQRQLLSLARSLLRPSTILLIDEATSLLDRISEEKLTEALTAHLRDAVSPTTMLMISHRKHGLRRICNQVSIIFSAFSYSCKYFYMFIYLI